MELIIKSAEDVYSLFDEARNAAIADILTALEESVKLQSHYAGLLNAYDGGGRLQFASATEWLERLAVLRRDTK